MGESTLVAFIAGIGEDSVGVSLCDESGGQSWNCGSGVSILWPLIICANEGKIGPVLLMEGTQ